MLQLPIRGRRPAENFSRVENRRLGAPARSRWVSPMLRRILLVNLLPLALLLAALLYLDQYQNGLLEAEVLALREQARIYAGALAESAVNAAKPDRPQAGAGDRSAAAAPRDRADPGRPGQDLRA